MEKEHSRQHVISEMDILFDVSRSCYRFWLAVVFVAIILPSWK